MIELTEQQTLYLLIGVPAVITGILVYMLTLMNRNRIIAQQQKDIEELSFNKQENLEALHELQTRQALIEQQAEQRLEQNQNLNQQLEQAQQATQQLQQAVHRKQTELETLQVAREKDLQHQAEKLAEFEKNKEQLKSDFESLSQQILKSTQQEFSTKSQEGLELFLKPFRQQISDFRDKVETIHTNDLKQREALKTELKHLQELNRQITEEAHQLSTALKGQKKTQGNWGELILENVLDRSGLQAGKDYQREQSFNTEEGRRRPDVIVYLPEEKHLVIDAKVSLNAYTAYVNAEDDLEREQYLRQHIQALTDRIKELSSKNYFELPGLKSPEMVFMFVPIESAFVEAIRNDEKLFQMAIEQQVLVTTPTTLLTSLNVVRQLWRFEDQNKHSAQLADQAGKVYNQLRLFLESLEALGVQLDKSRKLYDEAMNRFISGKGNLVKRVEDFQKLGVSVKKEMPAELLQKAGLELDLIDSPQDSKES